MKIILASSCILMALAVALGAFGSHGLEGQISERYLAIYKTANFYHFIHGLALLIVPFLLHTYHSRRVLLVANLFLVGIFLFSGSLYLLALWEIFEVPELKKLGAVTPIGGVILIAAWMVSAYQFLAMLRKERGEPEP